MYVCLRVLKKCRFLLLLLSFLYCSFSLCSISGSVSLCLSISHPHIPAHTCAHENSQFKAGFLFIYLFTCLPSHLLFLTLFSKRTDETVCVCLTLCLLHWCAIQVWFWALALFLSLSLAERAPCSNKNTYINTYVYIHAYLRTYANTLN